MTRVVIADDQELVRTGFRLILDLAPDMEVVGEAGDGESCVRVVTREKPDVVLMDVQMPGVDGIEATRRILASGSATRVLVLTTFDLDEYVVQALHAGAAGFLLKDAPRGHLLDAIRRVADGDAVLAPAVTRRLIERVLRSAPAAEPLRARIDQLSERERDVLVLIARSLTNAEIAARLHVSETTVKTYVARMLTKLDVRDRLQAIVVAYESGFISPGSGPSPRGAAR
ncbi:MAG TPA: response regulator transcription factor [Protaetiibacter sp.]|jgi:DNA-binding NarL/FixJ family response regulator|nr:response regulator transcription factor [Protaetiibacter sp.]